MRKENLLYIPVALLALAFFVESSFPQPEFIDLSIHLRDKIFHFIGYFVLGLSVQMAAYRRNINIKTSTLLWITLLFGSIYGASDEIHQYFVPGRSCDILDWLADTLGSFSSILLYKQIRKSSMSLVAFFTKDNK